MSASSDSGKWCVSRACASGPLRWVPIWACVMAVLFAMSCGDQRLTRKFSEDHASASNGTDASDAGDASQDTGDGVSNEEWFDAQEEVLAPWVHEIDLETAQAATIEEDSVSWSLDAYPEMAEWQVQDIIWSPVSDPSYAFIRRVLEIDQSGSQVTFYTRKAGLDEVFAKTRDPDAGGG